MHRDPSLARRTALLFVALALLLGVKGPAPADQSAPAALARAVDAVGITVSDMDRAIAFYTRVLFFEKVSDVEAWGDEVEHVHGVFGARLRVARLTLGAEAIELTEFLTPRGRPLPADSRSNDRWFQHVAIVVNDIDQAYLWLRRHRVEHVSPAPQTLPDWNPSAGGIRAFYFKDPDGHPLEILQFPPGKGDPRWHRPSERVFLGIDHTAIVVGATDASLRFWRDALGLRVAGRSENWGPEQERLNNVFGARLRITTLRAAAGPGVELLEYLAPPGGRAAPVDARANDLAHWQVVLATPDAGAAAAALRAARAPLVSSRVVTLPDAGAAPRAAFVARDPDGHALQLRSR